MENAVIALTLARYLKIEKNVKHKNAQETRLLLLLVIALLAQIIP